MSYVAPVKDMLFDIRHLANIEQVAQLPGFEDAGFDTAQAVLEEAARFNQDVIAPLNWEGDRNPSSWKDGVVTTTPGFKRAFEQFVEGGWQGLQHPAAFGGQGLPKTRHNRLKVCAQSVSARESKGPAPRELNTGAESKGIESTAPTNTFDTPRNLQRDNRRGHATLGITLVESRGPKGSPSLSEPLAGTRCTCCNNNTSPRSQNQSLSQAREH
jgi:hypothetical protein